MFAAIGAAGSRSRLSPCSSCVLRKPLVGKTAFAELRAIKRGVMVTRRRKEPGTLPASLVDGGSSSSPRRSSVAPARRWFRCSSKARRCSSFGPTHRGHARQSVRGHAPRRGGRAHDPAWVASPVGGEGEPRGGTERHLLGVRAPWRRSNGRLDRSRSRRATHPRLRRQSDQDPRQDLGRLDGRPRDDRPRRRTGALRVGHRRSAEAR
jgi:hypothetical protein